MPTHACAVYPLIGQAPAEEFPIMEELAAEAELTNTSVVVCELRVDKVKGLSGNAQYITRRGKVRSSY